MLWRIMAARLKMKMGGKHFQIRSLKILKNLKIAKKGLTRTIIVNMKKISLRISTVMETSQIIFKKNSLESINMQIKFKIMIKILTSSLIYLFPFKEMNNTKIEVNIFIIKYNLVKIANYILRKIRIFKALHQATK